MFNRRDLGPSLILLGLCIAGFSLTFQFDEVPAILAQGMQPYVFPRMLFALLLVLTLLLVLQGWRHGERDRDSVGWRVWATIAVMAIAVAALEEVGGLIMLSLAIFAIPLIWGERRITRVAALAVIGPAAIYVIFTLLLQLRLPPGWLEGLV